MELSEVEVAANSHPEVISSVAVICRRSDGDDRLVLYLKASSKAFQRLTQSVEEHLASTLPIYMVPSMIIPVDDYASTTSGKIDRRRMASADYVDSAMENSFTAELSNGQDAMTEQEKAIAGIFSDILAIPESRIGLNSNLFELGGHSLLAVRILGGIQRSFGVQLSMSAFFDDPSVANVVHLLRVSASEGTPKAFQQLSRLNQDSAVFLASRAQRRLWLEETMNPGLSRYNGGFQESLHGSLDVQALRSALISILKRHEALRTTFYMQDGLLFQEIKEVPENFVRVIDLGDNSQQILDLDSFLEAEFSRPFDLGRELPVRIVVLTHSDSQHYLSFVMHHICMDGWSLRIIKQELAALYNAVVKQSPTTLPHLPIRYADFSVWQNKQLDGALLHEQLHFWSQNLQGSHALEMRTDFRRPETFSGRAEELSFVFTAEVVGALKALAGQHGASLHVILLAAFRAALYRITGDEDGNIGCVNANRSYTELEGIVGFFVNLQAIRIPIDANTDISAIISITKRVAQEALKHSDVPFDEVVASVSPKREAARHPLVQIKFSGTLDNSSEPSLEGTRAEELRRASTRLDLSVHLIPAMGQLKGYLNYNPDLFEAGSILQLVNIFKSTISAMLTTQSSTQLSKLSLASDAELTSVLEWGRGSRILVPPQSLVDLFRESVRQNEALLAVKDDVESLTYSELDQESDSIASWLVSRQALQTQSVVGVWIGRSALLVKAYLGCLKAGMAYLPLDKALPTDRIRTMLQVSGCRFVLSSGAFPLSREIPSVDLQHRKEILTSQCVELPMVPANFLSNIMFTSGSTGVPKGIMIEHRGMVNLCGPETTDWPGKLKNGLTTGVNFDPSGFQIFTTLLTGSELHILQDTCFFDPLRYREYLMKSGVQRVYMTPSVLAVLLEDNDEWLTQTSLSVLMLGGEKLDPYDIVRCQRQLPSLRVISSYGPAEATIRSARYSIDFNSFNARALRVPIGTPEPNTCLHILDDDLKPVPPGVLGQIVLSGAQISRGYINNEAMNRESFTGALYLTGDLGYWSSDGLAHFVGRKDLQLKLRGQRLEAGEIEAAINQHSQVQQSAVALVSSELGDNLTAYIQLKDDKTSAENDLLDLWDTQYNKTNLLESIQDEDAGHDFANWISMWTGERISFVEMESWLEDTLHHIGARDSDRILEIGVGTGQIALNLIDRVDSYIGTDISLPALEYIGRQVRDRGLSGKLQLHKCGAHQLEEVITGSFASLVIVNSVTQYFPSASYFIEVLKSLVRSVAVGGRIFVGDVRSFSLIQFHDLERALATLESSASLDDIKEAMKRFGKVQSELLLDPAFFHQLRDIMPEVAHVEIIPKTFEYRNELSRYRYNVVLHIHKAPPIIVPETSV
ncbi:AMP-binding-domain-containing protein, partial [Dendrothele bispora CBS 962.96]